MKILYLDTSSSFLYSALFIENKVVDSIAEYLKNDLSSYALPNIIDLLKRNDLDPKDINKIIVVTGPGSFTGIRIGATIAKVMAFSLNIPIIELSSLITMALSSESYDYYIPCIDARRDYVYSAIYDKKYSIILEEQYISTVKLLEIIQELKGTVTLITNDDVNIGIMKNEYKPNFEKIISYAMNKMPSIPHKVDANYLKRTEAEENNDNKANN